MSGTSGTDDNDVSGIHSGCLLDCGNANWVQAGFPALLEKPVTAKIAKNSRNGREDQPPHFFTDCWLDGFGDAAAFPVVFPDDLAWAATFPSSTGIVRRAFSSDR